MSSGRNWSRVNQDNLVRRRQLQYEDELIALTPPVVVRSAQERAAERELEGWVRSYEGSKAFVLKMKAELSKPGIRYLTSGQARVIRTIMREEGHMCRQ